jgi:hypothetical protein
MMRVAESTKLVTREGWAGSAGAAFGGLKSKDSCCEEVLEDPCLEDPLDMGEPTLDSS